MLWDLITCLKTVDMIAQNSTLQNLFNSFEVIANCSGSNVVVKVLDAQGRIAKTVRQTLKESVDRVCLNVEDLRKGKYIINIFTDDNFIKAVHYIKD